MKRYGVDQRWHSAGRYLSGTYAVVLAVWQALLLPFRLASWLVHGLVAAGQGMVRLAAACLFGLLGLLVLGQLCFGLGYVLLYPLFSH